MNNIYIIIQLYIKEYFANLLILINEIKFTSFYSNLGKASNMVSKHLNDLINEQVVISSPCGFSSEVFSSPCNVFLSVLELSVCILKRLFSGGDIVLA